MSANKSARMEQNRAESRVQNRRAQIPGIDYLHETPGTDYVYILVGSSGSLYEGYTTEEKAQEAADRSRRADDAAGDTSEEYRVSQVRIRE